MVRMAEAKLNSIRLTLMRYYRLAARPVHSGLNAVLQLSATCSSNPVAPYLIVSGTGRFSHLYYMAGAWQRGTAFTG